MSNEKQSKQTGEKKIYRPELVSLEERIAPWHGGGWGGWGGGGNCGGGGDPITPGGE